MENNNKTEVTAMGALTGESVIHIDYKDTVLFPSDCDVYLANVKFKDVEEFLVSHNLTETKEPIKFDENTYYYNLVPGVHTSDNIALHTMFPEPTEIKKFMVFKDPNLKWLRIKYRVEKMVGYETRVITVTDDHPLTVLKDVDKGFVNALARDIKVGDRLRAAVTQPRSLSLSCEVTEVIELDEQYIGYDIETSTDRFDVNGIVIHH